jgi:hypothetical protein
VAKLVDSTNMDLLVDWQELSSDMFGENKIKSGEKFSLPREVKEEKTQDCPDIEGRQTANLTEPNKISNF